MTTLEILEEIKKAANENDRLECFGIRRAYKSYKLGDTLDDSHVWIDGEITEEELDGASAIYINEQPMWYYDLDEDEDLEYFEKAINKAMNKIESYHGYYTYLIASDYAQGGEDSGERVFRDAKLIAIID